MNKISKYNTAILCIAVLVIAACIKHPFKIDKQVIILRDKTDHIRVKPDAGEITNQLGLTQDLWQGIIIETSNISDKDVNATRVISLEKGDSFTGNKQLREANVAHFRKQLRDALADSGETRILDHSIIYRTIVKQLNMLSASTAINRYLLVYSDLMENSDISFYDPATLKLIRAHPEIVKHQLESSSALPSLPGVQVWLIYDPTSFNDNNIYMAIANIYKQLLESKGARVHIEKTLNL